jgi:N-acetyl-D-muramate 6-phosphate phosphatase
MTTSNPAAILFDLDGTLIDTAPDFQRAVNTQRQRHSLKNMDLSQIRQHVSEGARALIKLSFAIDEAHADFETLRQELLTLYLDQIAVESRLFEGFEKVLGAMEANGMPWGIVTNKPRLYSEALLAQLGLDSRSATLICPDDVSHTKPHPEPLFMAAKHLQKSATDIWYVGDHGRDIEAGRRAGMKTFAAAYGYIPAGESVTDWQADHIINDPRDLLAMLSFT